MEEIVGTTDINTYLNPLLQGVFLNQHYSRTQKLIKLF